MILRDAITDYIAWRQAHGAKFHSSASVLHCFCKHVGGHTGCDAVAEADVLGFLAGNGSLTRYRANKYGALAGFYRYAISRGYARRSPLPARDDEPKRPRPAASHVYSRNELQRLFSAIDVSRRRAFRLDADTLRALLLLLYGRGCVWARHSACRRRNTKFYPSAECRQAGRCSRRSSPSFREAGISRSAFTPCAMPRPFTGWSRGTGRRRSRVAPALSTFGHADLDGTRVYLSMTPELLPSFGASQRVSACMVAEPPKAALLPECFASRDPGHLEWSMRRHPRGNAAADRLAQQDRLLAAPRGRIEHALLLFLQPEPRNSSRATSRTTRWRALVNIHGKGGKHRQCPLWPRTEAALASSCKDGQRPVFLTSSEDPIRGSGSTGSSSAVPACRRSPHGGSHLTRSVTRCHLLQESSAPGSVMPASIPPTSTPRSISR